MNQDQVFFFFFVLPPALYMCIMGVWRGVSNESEGQTIKYMFLMAYGIYFLIAGTAYTIGFDWVPV